MKGILLVHGSARMGGVETLLLRLAREFSSRGTSVRVLLLGRTAEPELIAELGRHAAVTYLDQLTTLPCGGSERLALLAGLAGLKRGAVEAVLAGVEHLHFTESLTMALSASIVRHASSALRVSGGVYHQNEYLYPDRRPRYFCGVMAQLFVHHAAGESLLFFSEAARDRLAAHYGLDLAHCPVLPIGIDLQRSRERSAGQARRCKVVSVGRITEFKTYNVRFLDAVAALRRRGMPIEYHIYGDGPAVDKVRRRIAELGLQSAVQLHGNLEYSKFPETIADAGLFVGSGTALIEAAACGVPALIGIESQADDSTYGFLHEMSGIAYHEQGIDHPQAPFAEHVARLVSLGEAEYRAVCAASVRKAQTYSIGRLVDGWIEMDHRSAAVGRRRPTPEFNRLRFIGSLLFDRLAVPAGSDSGFWSRYDRATGPCR